MLVLRCPDGHEWNRGDGPNEGRCPYCGAAGQSVRETQPAGDQTLAGSSQLGSTGAASEKTQPLPEPLTLPTPAHQPEPFSMPTLAGQTESPRTLATPASPSLPSGPEKTLGVVHTVSAANPFLVEETLDPATAVRPAQVKTRPGSEKGDSVDSGFATLPGTNSPDTEKTKIAQDHATLHPAVKAPPSKEVWKRTVAGYEILGELGRGGMGVVYKARQPGLNRLVALKMILAGEHAGTEQKLRFKIEAEAIAHLQHVNIVQVYDIGEEQGCPYFALEFVDGESLSKRIETAPQPPAESARIVRALCQAMYLAHQRGIIHRDLKPANVLMTLDGVPKVTDFGLAKRFEEQDQGQTRTGSIMGTPSYMAPEQAQGKTKLIGPPADIYSLGAILYDLLTGRPPFRGTTLLETLQQVQKLDPVPPGRLQPHLPRDLETICLKALEKEPARRYASAGEMADDLGRFLAGEPILARPIPWWERGWKWAKRRPAVAALISVSVLAVISLVTLGGLWLDTERQAALDREQQQTELARIEKERATTEEYHRKHAEENFQRAVRAVDEMLTRVGQEKLAHIPQMERVRQELLEKALAFYKDFRHDKNNDPAIRWENARAQQRVADILEMLGRHPQSKEAYLAALELYRELVRDFPNNQDYRHDLAAATSNLGNLFKDLKLHGDAEKTYRESLRWRRELLKQTPGQPKFILELAKNHINLGNLLLLENKPQEAEKEFLMGQHTLADLTTRFPKVPLTQVELARCLNNLGTLQKSMGKTVQAEKSYQEALAILKKLSGQFKEVPDYRQDLALSHHLLGDLFLDTQAKKSLEHYQQAIQLRKQLTTQFPGVPAYQQELANSYRSLALLHQAQGQQKEADQAYQTGLTIQEDLANAYPHLPDYRRNLASSYNNRGIMLLTAKRFKEGEAALEQAQQIFAQLAADYSDVPDYEMELAGIYLNRGTVCQSSGRFQEAKDFYQLALSTRRRLADKYPGVPVHQQELAGTLMNLGTLLQLHQQPAEAEKAYTEARDLFAHLASQFPTNPDYRYQEAISHSNLGNLLRTLNQNDRAEKAWAKAIAGLDQLIKDFPENLRYSQEMARVCNELGIFLVGIDRLEEAGKIWDRAIELQKELLAQHPEQADLRTELARSLGNRGVVFTRSNQVEQAEKTYRQAIALLEEYAAKLSADPSFTRELINCHNNLANLLVTLQKTGAAEKSWLRVLEMQEALVKNFPASPDFAAEVIRTLNDLGNRLTQKEKFAEARPYYQKAVDYLQPWTKGPDASKAMVQSLYFSQLNLATTVVGMGDHALAVGIVDQASKLEAGASLHQHFAALVSRAIPLAEKDSKISQERRQELVQTYAAQAIKLLRTAVEQGFNEVAFLTKNDDFEPLRMRPDFQALIRQLEKK